MYTFLRPSKKNVRNKLNRHNAPQCLNSKCTCIYQFAHDAHGLVWKQGVFRCIVGALLFWGNWKRLHDWPTKTLFKAYGAVFLNIYFKSVLVICTYRRVHNGSQMTVLQKLLIHFLLCCIITKYCSLCTSVFEWTKALFVDVFGNHDQSVP